MNSMPLVQIMEGQECLGSPPRGMAFLGVETAWVAPEGVEWRGLGLAAKPGERGTTPQKRAAKRVWTDVSAARLDALMRIEMPTPSQRCKRRN
jgi:hypothetical protein